MLIKVNYKNYLVAEDEFKKINHNVFTHLKILEKVEYFEKLISIINETSSLFNNLKKKLIIENTTHGGFLPIQCSEYFDTVVLLNTNKQHYNNILENLKKHNKTNIIFADRFDNKFGDDDIDDEFVIYVCIGSKLDVLNTLNKNKTIVITDERNYKEILKEDFVCYEWNDLFIFVDKRSNTYFYDEFYYYVSNSISLSINDTESDKTIETLQFNYDNLNNLCIMVKNGGPQFEKMLLDNIEQFDRWTILDTGSTDETIEIINKVLVGKKKGNLYQEPFINFRDSRNRLLDLAGTQCKFNTMLDDTYVIQGNLRKFLNEVRGDQYSDSFTLFIQSDDTSYGSNRIIKSLSGLRYVHKIHEVITDRNNINIVIPIHISKIEDRRFDYMEKRTMERKQLDLKLLYEEVDDDPNNPRSYYYLAQTYNILEEYEKCFYYFNKRCEYINSGFLQERYDAAFEAARMANFKLNKPWDECYELYNRAFKIDESRPEPMYFIGIHYYLDNDLNNAYKYLKKGFEIGYPEHCQYSLKPTLSFHFLPKFLARCCYQVEDFILGEKSSEFFLLNNKENAEDYQEILSWYQIYKKLNAYKGLKQPVVHDKPILCFVADGGFSPWSGSNILTTGVGGSETYIIEMARYIKKISNFDVYVFCNTPDEKDELFEGVLYKHLNSYYKFINTNYVKHCIISRFSEYLPVTFKGFTENVYLVVHDLTPSGIVIPIDNKLKNIFCLTEWHVDYMSERFPSLKHLLVPFYYGIDSKFMIKDISIKVPYSFIYSSFPNRGLLPLLQMWPRIYEIQPMASLHIYADINGKWVNDVAKEEMNEIRNILAEYNKRPNSLNIFYHGWVKKSVLAEAWKRADIWFYPCTFMETFCLTALEAAASKTLCITNDLAALQNTVGNRGIIIKGNPITKEWQEQALTQIKILFNEDKIRKSYYIEKNFKWATNQNWENQANNLTNLFLLKHSEYNLNNVLDKILNIPLINKNDYHIVKIGAFTGNIPNDIIYHTIKSDTKIMLIEPIPLFFTTLKHNYNNKFLNNNFTFINKAISNFNGKMKMYYPSSTNDFNNLPWWINQLGSKNIDHSKKHNYDIDLDCVNVNTITFNNLVCEYNINNILLLFIDTDGSDYDILTAIDFNLIKPRFIIFENMHLTDTKQRGHKYNKLIEYLHSKNYSKIDENESYTLMMLNI
jgi:FkbM family methyltransferase